MNKLARFKGIYGDDFWISPSQVIYVTESKILRHGSFVKEEGKPITEIHYRGGSVIVFGHPAHVAEALDIAPDE